MIGRFIHSRYRVDGLLGRGGMGAVYRARDTRLKISVAVKVLRPDPIADAQALAQLRQQFKHEAHVVAGLDHPNLVRVTDYFTWNNSECLVMNLVEGESLAERIERQGAQSETQVLVWAEQLLDGLAYCHARAVVHRDVKPQNVIITPEGKPILVDFGLVKLWDPHNPRTRTAIRAMGTPEYAPPEQYSRAAGHTDPRSDLYGVGATLYHALTGRAPMSATDRMAMPERFAPPRRLAPGVSRQSERVVLKAMELPVTQRFSTAREMRDALGQIEHGSTPKRQKLPGWALGLGGGILVLLLIGCFLGIGLLTAKRRRRAESTIPATVSRTAESQTSVEDSTAASGMARDARAHGSGTASTRAAGQALSTSTPKPTIPIPTATPCVLVFDSYRDGDWEVYRMDEDGSNPYNLTQHPADDGDPNCSGLRGRIAFDTDRDGNWEIYAMDPDGSDLTRLTDHPADDDTPAWSPDGSKVVFKSNRDGNWEVYVVNVADLDVTNLSNHPSDDRVAAWSPDGRHIAFVSDRTGDWDIWRMNADGSNPINLTRHEAQDAFPDWSPDGQRIAFHSYRDGNAEIYTVNADGSNLTRLTRHSADDWGASWSRDGSRLAFTSDRDGDNEIYVMNADGNHVVQVTHNDASDTWPVWLPAHR